MTRLLDQAILKLRDLSESEQDAIAALILAEIADEALWDHQFASSQERLSEFARKARQDIRNGDSREKGIDEL